MLTRARITLLGYLGRDAEIKSSKSSGEKFVVFPVATNYRRGETEHTSWFSVSVFSEYLVKFAQDLTSGSPVYIEGDLIVSTYIVDDDGEKEERKEVKIFARDIVLLERSPEEEEEEEEAPPKPRTKRR